MKARQASQRALLKPGCDRGAAITCITGRPSLLSPPTIITIITMNNLTHQKSTCERVGVSEYDPVYSIPHSPQFRAHSRLPIGPVPAKPRSPRTQIPDPIGGGRQSERRGAPWGKREIGRIIRESSKFRSAGWMKAARSNDAAWHSPQLMNPRVAAAAEKQDMFRCGRDSPPTHHAPYLRTLTYCVPTASILILLVRMRPSTIHHLDVVAGHTWGESFDSRHPGDYRYGYGHNWGIAVRY
ncbi:hypothetical protein N658DRAFT_108110 [Parathielavia hyrcaniae]|uniref:Uncharacterized protein n=1 Tax=Parathielavia hyrcaniae TaxID=113614 RepID=A0AAN6PYH5_9PEZI|nr:hypothetical protein N658DRAFT_108110 [Parathielavia hyrcaniae]